MCAYIYLRFSLLLLAACNREPVSQAPLFDDPGTLEFPITTKSDFAPKYFNQGLTLAYGFNHG